MDATTIAQGFLDQGLDRDEVIRRTVEATGDSRFTVAMMVKCLSMPKLGVELPEPEPVSAPEPEPEPEPVLYQNLATPAGLGHTLIPKRLPKMLTDRQVTEQSFHLLVALYHIRGRAVPGFLDDRCCIDTSLAELSRAMQHRRYGGWQARKIQSLLELLQTQEKLTYRPRRDGYHTIRILLSRDLSPKTMRSYKPYSHVTHAAVKAPGSRMALASASRSTGATVDGSGQLAASTLQKRLGKKWRKREVESRLARIRDELNDASLYDDCLLHCSIAPTANGEDLKLVFEIVGKAAEASKARVRAKQHVKERRQQYREDRKPEPRAPSTGFANFSSIASQVNIPGAAPPA